MPTRTAVFLLAALIVAPLVGSVPRPAHGAVLLERSLTVDRSLNIFNTSDFGLRVDLAPSFLAPAASGSPLFAASISPADVGLVLHANAANTPGFAGLADKLTDSADDVLRVVFQELASGRAEKRGFNDRSLFATAASSPGMGGASIQELQLEIGRFSLIPPTTPLASGGSPQVDLGLTLRVIGQAVPEPAGLVWFAAATAWIGRRLTKRRWSPRT